VHWYPGFNPKLVEILPNRCLHLDPLVPQVSELNEIFIRYRTVMCAWCHHVKETRHAVEWTSTQQNCTLCFKSRFAPSFGIMSLNDPNARVSQSFTRQPQCHKLLIELFCYITIGACCDSHDSFKCRSEECIAWAWITGHHNHIVPVFVAIFI